MSVLSAPRTLVILLATGAVFAGAAPASAAVKGQWRGTATILKGGEGRFEVAMNITRLRRGGPSGTIDYPGTACRGTIRLRTRRDGGYEFRYRERSGSSRCTNGDRIFVKSSGGQLRWRARARGGRVVARARLRRP